MEREVFVNVAQAARCLFAAAATLSAIPMAGAWAQQQDVVPHRAIYDMRLSQARSASQITGVSGRMLFEWADACEGWTVEQRFQLTFQYAEGNRVELVTNQATWESKDGASYRFNVRRLVNGEVDEELRGEARMFADGSGGRVRYLRPEVREDPLPAGTMFPTAHTLALIQAAINGDRFNTAIVFDGADAEGASQVTAAIGNFGPSRATSGAGRARGGNLLADGVYPVRLAFFPLSGDGLEPEYEIGVGLLKNGISDQLLIDYGDFRVIGILQELEALPKPNC